MNNTTINRLLFLKACKKLHCEHSCEVSNVTGEPWCTCFEGYALNPDNQTCVHTG